LAFPGRDRAGELAVWQSLALGALHGPAELLPVSSSGHIAVIPWLAGWTGTHPPGPSGPDDELRKGFEVALHAGTAAALLIGLRRELLQDVSVRRLGVITLSCLPAAVAGSAFERPVERHLGRPGSVAAGLVAGAVALVVADRAPQRRAFADADAVDAVALGVAQACALVPGVSRSGATLTAARLRRFTRPAANRLSWDAALPVIAGATGLKGLRLRRRGLPPGAVAPFVAGAGAAFVSTLASIRLIHVLQNDRPLWPYAVYRVVLASVIAAKLTRA
jgi:undecaprenyl-diphosphatase